MPAATKQCGTRAGKAGLKSQGMRGLPPIPPMWPASTVEMLIFLRCMQMRPQGQPALRGHATGNRVRGRPAGGSVRGISRARRSRGDWEFAELSKLFAARGSEWHHGGRSSRHVRPAVDMQYLAGDGIGILGSEEHRSPRNLIGRQHLAPERNCPRHLDQFCFGVAVARLGRVGRYRARWR